MDDEAHAAIDSVDSGRESLGLMAVRETEIRDSFNLDAFDDIVIEIFENERRIPVKGYSGDHLFMHPKFSDSTGKIDQNITSLASASPPLDHIWIEDWKLDLSHTQTDSEGWSYAVSYEFLVSNCEKGTSITAPNLLQNSRRRKWRRIARPIDHSMNPVASMHTGISRANSDSEF